MTATAWMADAACRGLDPALFHPGRGEDTTAAKAICARCPVRAECLDYAMGDPREKHGVWGGRSERERRNLARRRRYAHRRSVGMAG